MAQSFSPLLATTADLDGYRLHRDNDWNNGAPEGERCPLITRETQIRCRHVLTVRRNQKN